MKSPAAAERAFCEQLLLICLPVRVLPAGTLGAPSPFGGTAGSTDASRAFAKRLGEKINNKQAVRAHDA